MNPETPNEPTPNGTKTELPLALLLLPSSLPVSVDANALPAEEQGENSDVDRKKNLNELTGSSFPLPQDEPANAGSQHDVVR